MRSVSASELKANFSKVLRRVARGQTILVTRRGAPVALLVPVSPRAPRPLGFDKGVRIGADFDAPLPPDILKGFFG